MKKVLYTLVLLCYSFYLFSQTVTQTVKGTVIDQITSETLLGATVELLNSYPLKGTVTNENGDFLLEKVPAGRQSFKISMLGYEPYFVRELMVTSGKEIELNISLTETLIKLDEIVISNKREKNKAINSMATLSSRQFTVEETQKYAGGMNDPSRLVSSFAGVASPAVNNNGISIRGNSPSGLLWLIDGVEVSSPNHFADVIIAGAGLLTVLSSQVLSTSDFFTGAFPAQYGNAFSGVFDINLRKGNNTKRESTLQAGVLGLDFATEGPFKKGKESSYLLNYRYSTLGLVSMLFPNNEAISYQDLSFKINMPTKKLGTFSIWGVGGYDGIKVKALDKDEWSDVGDRENGLTSVHMFATSLNHKIAVASKSFLRSSFSYSGYGLSHRSGLIDDNLIEHRESDAYKNNDKWTLQSSLKTYFSDKHINSTGFYINRLSYNFNVAHKTAEDTLIKEIINEDGESNLYQFYTQSKLDLTRKLTLNIGLHAQYFQLNNKYSIEPRSAIKYQFNKRNSIAFAYGLHSKIEPLAIYFIKDDLGKQPNKDLDIMKSHHFVFSFSTMLSDNVNLIIEPYYQYLTDVPVSPNSYISTLNNNENLFFNYELVSEGKGRNMGVDFTLERYLKNGLYYMLTASIFDSKYTPIDGIERNTRFNKNYVANALIGKEWQVGKNHNNFFNADIRLNYLGGNRVETINEEKTLLFQQIIYGEANGSRSFNDRYKDTPVVSLTFSFRKNKPKYSSVWMLQILNVTNTKEFQSHTFDPNTQKIEIKYGQNMIPNLSYRIEF